MIICFLKNKKGSTLAMLLMTITILTLLGTAILSLTLMGFKLKAIDSKNKIAFYISEAGLDQAYAIIGQNIQNAIDYSRDTYTPAELHKFIDGTLLADGINGERTKEANDRNNENIAYGTKYRSPFFYQRYFVDVVADHIVNKKAYDINDNLIGQYNDDGNLIKKYSGGKLYRAYTYDSDSNLIGEYDADGKEIEAEIGKIDEHGNLIPIEAIDVNAQIGGMIEYRIKKKLKEFFAKGYVDYLTTDIAANGNRELIDKLEDENIYQTGIDYQSGNEKLREVKITNAPSFGTLTPDSITGEYTQQMEIKFESATNVRNLDGTTGAEKKLGITFKIDIPHYDTPYAFGSKIIKLKRNVLWDKALTSDKNIIVTGNNVTVNGNIYATGTVPSNDSDYLHYGGIIVGDAYTHPTIVQSKKQGNLIVNGTVATSEYLQTRNSNSNIIVNGDVYCNSMLTQYGDDMSGTFFSNNNITINKDLNVLDNLEMNSKQSNILVKGSFFGFSSGEGITALHNQSSSIAINSDDVGRGSSLTILGEGDGKRYNVGGTQYELPNGTYIAGTVYVDYGLTITVQVPHGSVDIKQDGNWHYTPDPAFPGDIDITFQMTNAFGGTRTRKVTVNGEASGTIESSYQTGDSISIVGNYLGYSMTLTSIPELDEDNNPNEDYKYNNIADENFESIPPLVLVKQYLANDGTTVPMRVFDKSKYARFAKDEFGGIFNFGGDGIRVSNMRFSLGNFVELDETGNGNFQKMKGDGTCATEDAYIGAAGIVKYSTALTYKSNEYKYQTNRMADPQLENFLTAGAVLGTQAKISNFFNFSRFIKNYRESSSANTDTLYYTNTDVTKKDLVIKGKGTDVQDVDWISDENKDIIRLQNESLNGIIITKGDVYISGTVNFKGIIAAEGNIYILDDNPKTFTNDYNPNLLTAGNNYIIKTIYNDKKTVDTQIGDLFVQEDSWTKEINFITDETATIVKSTDNVDTHYKRLTDLMHVSAWKKY